MRASVYIAASLDGYIAREDGGLDWLPTPGSGPEAEDYGYRAFMNSVDVLVMGRATFEMVLSFGEWPYGNKPVVVLSSSPLEIPQNLPECVEHQNLPPSELVKLLDGRGVEHIYVDGGATIQRFLAERLVTRIIITTIPVILGGGIPLFGPLNRDIKLRHVETLSFDSGIVQSTYEVTE